MESPPNTPHITTVYVRLVLLRCLSQIATVGTRLQSGRWTTNFAKFRAKMVEAKVAIVVAGVS